MAGRNRPSFLKRQKEQKRLAKAAEKREARRLRKSDKATTGDDSDEFGSLEDLISPGDAEDDAGDEGAEEPDLSAER